MNAENCWCWMHSWPFLLNSVVGVPSVEDWPQEVALPQSAFTPRPPKPIENLVPDMDEQGRALLMVGTAIFCANQSKCITECPFSQIPQCLLYIIILQACPNGKSSDLLYRAISSFSYAFSFTAIPCLQPLQEDIGLCCTEPPLFSKCGQPQ